MSKTESSDVRQLVRDMGAEVVSSWCERCSHLIMTGITVTVKVSDQATCIHTSSMRKHLTSSS